jgi:hypothetical protein
MDTLDTFLGNNITFFHLNCLFSTDDDDVPGNRLKLLAEDGIRIVTTDQQHV